MFFTAIAAAIVIMAGSIASIAVCPVLGSRTMLGIELIFCCFGFIVFFGAVLTSFVVRLFVTFQNSKWQMPRRQLVVMMSCTVAVMAIGVAALIFYWLSFIDDRWIYAV